MAGAEDRSDKACRKPRPEHQDVTEGGMVLARQPGRQNSRPTIQKSLGAETPDGRQSGRWTWRCVRRTIPLRREPDYAASGVRSLLKGRRSMRHSPDCSPEVIATIMEGCTGCIAISLKAKALGVKPNLRARPSGS